MRITRRTGIEGASAATGAAIVIDTFRAFTTAAVLLDRGAAPLLLTETVDGARRLAADLDALLCGEDHGVRPDGFDLGNSPAEATTADVRGRPVVQRTTAGTRSVLAGMEAGAAPVHAASLVVASATAVAVGSTPELTIVSAGLHGVEPAFEDDRTGDLIAGLLAGAADSDANRSAVAADVASCPRAVELANAPWSGDDDVAIATDVDRYDFAMEAVARSDGLVELARRRRT